MMSDFAAIRFTYITLPRNPFLDIVSQFPPSMLGQSKFTKPDDLVVDPMSGTGSVLKAAVSLRRKAIITLQFLLEQSTNVLNAEYDCVLVRTHTRNDGSDVMCNIVKG